MILIAPDHIERDTGRLLAIKTSAEQGAISGKYRFASGDIVYSKIRPYLRKAIHARFDGLCSADMYPLRSADNIASGFMFAVILGENFSKYAESVSVRSGRPKINRAELAQYRLPLPPTKLEQEAIATALSDVDALIAGLDQLIAKKRDLKQAAMQQLLTGQKRLPGFHREWIKKRLGDVAEIVMGQSPSSTYYNTLGIGLPLIQGNADIQNRKTIRRVFTTEITKKGFSGDLLMSVRAPVGEISIATFDVCLGRGVCAIRFSNKFMYYCLINFEPSWSQLSKGSTFDSVNSNDVKSFELVLPADQEEQMAIATILSDMDSELAALEQRRDKVRALKQGVMQELLTGKTRLI